jgi:hypothetical protein
MKKFLFHKRLAWSVAVLLLLTWIALYTSGALNVLEPAAVSNLKTGFLTNGTFILSKSGPKLNSYLVCGNLNEPEPREISIVLQNLENAKSFGANEVSEVIAPGYFCSGIQVTKSLDIGNYKFVLYDRRYLIGEIEIEITE